MYRLALLVHQAQKSLIFKPVKLTTKTQFAQQEFASCTHKLQSVQKITSAVLLPIHRLTMLDIDAITAKQLPTAQNASSKQPTKLVPL